MWYPLGPIEALRQYLEKTQQTRQTIGSKMVFLATSQEKQLGDQRISKLLTQCLIDAGIEDATARSFRKTGASAAINSGMEPDMVMKLGRWKSANVFFNHYVNWEQEDTTNLILSHQGNPPMRMDEARSEIIRNEELSDEVEG